MKSERVPVISTLKVALVGKLENPVLYCCRAIFDERAKEMIIPLIVKRGENLQKYKLPFRLSNQMDVDFEFIFIKSSRPKDCNELEDKQVEIFECMQFFCQPNVLPVTDKA